MPSASALSLGVRRSTIRISGSRTYAPSIFSCQSHTRLFSSVLQHSSCLKPRSLQSLYTHGPLMVNRMLSLPSFPSRKQPDQEKISEETLVPEPSAFTPETLSDTVEASGSSTLDVTAALTSAYPAAVQYGDFAALGLASWWPSGIINWSLELINVTTGLPWFWTIVAGSVFWKIAIFPFSIAGLRNSARMQPYQGEMKALQDKIMLARMQKDVVALQQLQMEGITLRQKAGVTGAGMAMPLMQFPVTIGVFLGVKKLCESGLEPLKYSGFSWVPDLTMASEPFYQLPLLLCVLGNVQISVGASEMGSENKAMGHMLNGFRLLSVVFMFYMTTLPSGLLVALITTSAMSIVQSLLLKQASIRRLLKIPVLPKSNVAGRLPTPLETFQEYVAKPFREWRAMNNQK